MLISSRADIEVLRNSPLAMELAKEVNENARYSFEGFSDLHCRYCAAIDDEFGSCDAARAVGGEESNQVRDLLGG